MADLIVAALVPWLKVLGVVGLGLMIIGTFVSLMGVVGLVVFISYEFLRDDIDEATKKRAKRKMTKNKLDETAANLDKILRDPKRIWK